MKVLRLHGTKDFRLHDESRPEPSPGESLVLDSEERTAAKNGNTNVLSIVSGDFVELDPGGATLTYQDATSGDPQASLVVKWRDRWV